MSFESPCIKNGNMTVQIGRFSYSNNSNKSNMNVPAYWL